VATADHHDRALLLHGALRNEELSLAQVQRYGVDSYGDADYVHLYGMPPAAWFAHGVRVLGRTAVECTRDVLARAIARDVAQVAAALPAGPVAILDPFAGSANTLFWLMRHLPRARGIGWELDDGVFARTQRNLAAIGSPIDIACVDYRAGLRALTLADDELLIAFIAPPWGEALHPENGLDLRRTQPPVAEIVDILFGTFARTPMVCAVQVCEHVDDASLADLRARFDAFAVHTYALNARGRNHGIVVGVRPHVEPRGA
jgi:hypothetical protein